MLIDQHYTEVDGKISFSRQQASDFAKQVADDFNPLHDIETKRFCVPGDLLFSLVLAKYGISQHMHFHFSGMVTDEVYLSFPENSPQIVILGNNGKEYLKIEHSGNNSTNSELINNLTSSYVTFSGHTFPHILIPLMEAQGVIINPARPMVMYQSMLIELDRLDLDNIELRFNQQKTTLTVNGKRGAVCLAFDLKSNDEIVGRGEKHMVVSGLMPFEKIYFDQIVGDYNYRKAVHSK